MILDQWAAERPDVDVSAIAVIGRISRLEKRLAAELARVFALHGLEHWEYDVLATLRRSGAPFELTVGEMLDSMMLASGTISHRIDRLEGRGLVERRPDRTTVESCVFGSPRRADTRRPGARRPRRQREHGCSAVCRHENAISWRRCCVGCR